MPEEYLKGYKKELSNNSDAMVKKLSSNESLGIVAPEGGFFGFVDISRTGLKSDNFACRLLAERSVAVTPGALFSSDWDDHIRVSLVADGHDFVEGINRLDDFVRSL
jgi:aspartate/methionine/tyrosine aminotransferase